VSKNRRINVQLPNLCPSVTVTPQQAKLLLLVINAGAMGINRLQLFDSGCISAANVISEVRKLGADIRTERADALDRQGTTHKGVAHYTYHGWNYGAYTTKGFADNQEDIE